MKEIKFVYEEKQNGKYVQTHECTDKTQIYEDLSHELIAKKFHKCTWISSIREYTNYDGTRTIVITYSAGNGRRIYTISDH